MTISLTQFGPGDLQAAAAVLRKFARRSVPAQLRAFLACDRNLFIVASVDEACAGFAFAYELLRPDHASMLFLYSLDVLPQYRRSGVGTAIVSFLHRLAKQRHMKKLFVMTTRSNKPAVGLYKATGGLIENGDDLLFVYRAGVGGA